MYTGLKCIACDKKFEDGDDIVVCAECGTPYHRECYKKNGECINTELHDKHESFSAAAEHAKNIGTQIKCTKCGADNPPLALFCEKCGNPIIIDHNSGRVQSMTSDEMNENGSADTMFSGPFSVNFSDRLCGLNPNEEFDGVKASELADFVGNNTFFFMPVFKIMKDRRRKMTFNLSALICPTIYYAYRKMKGLTLITLIIQAIISIPGIIYFVLNLMASNNFPVNEITELISTININSPTFAFIYNASIFLNYIVMFFCGTFSNWVYYKYAIHRIKKLKKRKKGTPENIKSAGGTSLPAMIAMIVFISAVSFSLSYLLIAV